MQGCVREDRTKKEKKSGQMRHSVNSAHGEEFLNLTGYEVPFKRAFMTVNKIPDNPFQTDLFIDTESESDHLEYEEVFNGVPKMLLQHLIIPKMNLGVIQSKPESVSEEEELILNIFVEATERDQPVRFHFEIVTNMDKQRLGFFLNELMESVRFNIRKCYIIGFLCCCPSDTKEIKPSEMVMQTTVESGIDPTIFTFDLTHPSVSDQMKREKKLLNSFLGRISRLIMINKPMDQCSREISVQGTLTGFYVSDNFMVALHNTTLEAVAFCVIKCIENGEQILSIK